MSNSCKNMVLSAENRALLFSIEKKIDDITKCSGLYEEIIFYKYFHHDAESADSLITTMLKEKLDSLSLIKGDR